MTDAPFFTPLQNRALIKVERKDAHDFLQNLITNDMDNLAPGRILYACLLSPQGKFLFDFFVHQGLREHRFIAFVMAVPTVANYVDDHVFLKTLTIFCSDAGTMGNGFDIISIDMKNRCIVRLGNIRTIV